MKVTQCHVLGLLMFVLMSFQLGVCKDHTVHMSCPWISHVCVKVIPVEVAEPVNEIEDEKTDGKCKLRDIV